MVGLHRGQKIAAAALFAALAAVPLAACGAADEQDRQDAFDTIRDYLIATEKRQFARRCDELITRDAVERVGGRQECIRLGERTPRDFKAKDFKFDIQDFDHDSAEGELVHRPSGEKLVYRLERDGGRLRVDGVEEPVKPK